MLELWHQTFADRGAAGAWEGARTTTRAAGQPVAG
jgi:hypothetical protein